MIRSAEMPARQARIAELKRLITAGNYETQEKLEEAVDAFLWREENEREVANGNDDSQDLRRGHPK